MSSQDVFWINAGIGVAFVALFLIRRGNRAPTRLNLRAGETKKESAAPNQKALVKSASEKSAQRARRFETMSPEAQEAGAVSKREKSLNVLFNYNGHSWDAYEILGLPAGAAMPQVEAAYQKALTAATVEGRDFIESAYQSIRSHR